MKKGNTFIDFKKSESIIEQDKKTILTEEMAVIITTYFLIPIRFRINNVDVLEFNGDPWLPVPLLNFAIFGYEEFLNIYRKPFTECWLGDTGSKLILEKKGKKIRVQTSGLPQYVWIDSEELFYVFTKFVKEVREYLISEIPELIKFEFINGWVTGTNVMDYLVKKMDKSQTI